ncbi:MAG: hypothetical protein A2046_11855 [Bacteroidetes bacterium GWA2_30_7]|nr:MAG: hypothetical protein A2046_11855 [Bacteroidetes bacterium GWA2_30_7]
MKEYIKKDIGDYFFDRTNDFEMTPPEHIWGNIQSEICLPQTPVKPHFLRFWHYYIISAVIGIIAVSVYYFSITNTNNLATNKIIENANIITPENPQNEISENKIIISENVKINNIDSSVINHEVVDVKKEVAVEKIENKPIAKKVSSNNTSENVNTNPSNVKIDTNSKNNSNNNPVKNIKNYNISAASFENVKQIFFVNDSGKKSLIINNPTVNKFGFFEIDITSLLSGRYRIKVVTDKGEIEHKIENF